MADDDQEQLNTGTAGPAEDRSVVRNDIEHPAAT
jgi:hypothetical protein